MKRIITYHLRVERDGAKLQFQIKLPSEITKVIGIAITTNADNPYRVGSTGKPDGIFDNPVPTKTGDLWLRIADQRDVFYSEAVEFSLPRYDMTTDRKITKPGLGIGQKWFDGGKDEFFTLDVDIDNTIIEGYYEDISVVHRAYSIFIHLEATL